MSKHDRPRVIDLSHPLHNGIPMSPGLPPPRFEPFLTREASRFIYAGQAEFEITRLFLVGNTGTALDSPFHRHADGLDVARLPLERLVALPGFCIDQLARLRGDGPGAIEVALPNGLPPGCAVLIRTGWDRHWGRDDYWTSGPFLGGELVEALISASVAVVGVDFANVDDRSDPARPTHTRLLAAGIAIVENLRGLERLPAAGFRLDAVPLPIEGAAALPVRVLAQLGPRAGRDGGL